MRVLITCGPSYEPLDEVRRLTNLSTGALGVGLAEHLAAAGDEVVCLKGVGATHRDPGPPVIVDTFATNDDLEERLRHWAATGAFGAVFHAAALCDFRVAAVEDGRGRMRQDGKIPSGLGELSVRLVPTRKLMVDLRRRFPEAWIVGWKYEVDGEAEGAIERGRLQMSAYQTDVCVVNGPACGGTFWICEASGQTEACADRAALIQRLLVRLHPERG